MDRVVFSLFIHIPECRQDACVSYNWQHRVEEMERLRKGHEAYARFCGAHYCFFNEASKEFRSFRDHFATRYPFLTSYELVNFFKIHMLYELSLTYDEILYLDFDVIPFTYESFFDALCMSQGLCVKRQTAAAIQMINEKGGHANLSGPRPVSKRSTAVKFLNCHAMLVEEGCNTKSEIFNTGIIGASPNSLASLDYFGAEFDASIGLIYRLRERAQTATDVANLFAYDNETILSFIVRKRGLNVVDLCDRFHFICKKKTRIPEKTVLVHAIHKEFEHVWKQCPKNLLRRSFQSHLL